MEIVEYRGVEGLVAAEVTKDDATGYVTGTPFAVAGVAQISRTTESNSEAHYYDNIPAVVVMNTSSDTVTINASAVPLDVIAKLTGQAYDSATGSLVEAVRDVKYFAIGYKTKKTNGDEMYVWRYKGTFNIPDETNITEDASTTANGQELVFTGISTSYKFAKTGKGAKALVVDTAKELANVTNFFTAVVTPDTLAAATQRTVTITEAANTTVTVLKNGSIPVETGDKVNDGDRLTITVTGGTVTVNAQAFYSGDTHVVTGNVAIVSAASA